MARMKRDNALASREARNALRQRGEPYWRTLQRGLSLGYRKSRDGGAWLARHYVGAKRYEEQRLGTADDNADPDGIKVLSFAQAQRAAFDSDTLRSQQGAGVAYTVSDAVRDYVEYLRTERKSGDDAKAKLAAYVSPELGATRLVDLTLSDLERWRDAATKRQRKARKKVATKRGKAAVAAPKLTDEQQRERARRRKSTANRITNYLKAALSRAQARGHGVGNTAWSRLRRFKNADASRTRWLSVEESRRLLNACSTNLRPLVHAALLTGCRQGELLNLQGRDFDADSESLRVAESKSGKPRAVPLTEEACALFESLAAGRERSPLFVRPDGQGWHRVEIGRELAKAVRGAGIAPITFHELRHTFASQLIQKKVPMLYVATALGHSDSRMVEKHYGHLAQSHFADTIRASVPSLGAVPVDNVKTMAKNRKR